MLEKVRTKVSWDLLLEVKKRRALPGIKEGILISTATTSTSDRFRVNINLLASKQNHLPQNSYSSAFQGTIHYYRVYSPQNCLITYKRNQDCAMTMTILDGNKERGSSDTKRSCLYVFLQPKPLELSILSSSLLPIILSSTSVPSIPAAPFKILPPLSDFHENFQQQHDTNAKENTYDQPKNRNYECNVSREGRGFLRDVTEKLVWEWPTHFWNDFLEVALLVCVNCGVIDLEVSLG